jgi:hypothetical protein
MICTGAKNLRGEVFAVWGEPIKVLFDWFKGEVLVRCL